jgi:hypothetical protein
MCRITTPWVTASALVAAASPGEEELLSTHSRGGSKRLKQPINKTAAAQAATPINALTVVRNVFI